MAALQPVKSDSTCPWTRQRRVFASYWLVYEPEPATEAISQAGRGARDNKPVRRGTTQWHWAASKQSARVPDAQRDGRQLARHHSMRLDELLLLRRVARVGELSAPSTTIAQLT